MIRSHVLICGGTGCTSSGSQTLQKAFNENIEAFGLAEEVKLVQTGCFGLCALGPVVIVYPDGTFYSRVTPEDVKEIVEEHLLARSLILRHSKKLSRRGRPLPHFLKSRKYCPRLVSH